MQKTSGSLTYLGDRGLNKSSGLREWEACQGLLGKHVEGGCMPARCSPRFWLQHEMWEALSPLSFSGCDPGLTRIFHTCCGHRGRGRWNCVTIALDMARQAVRHRTLRSTQGRVGVAYFKHKVLLEDRIPCLSGDSHTGLTLFVAISSLSRCPQSLALSNSKMQWHRSLCPKGSAQEGKGKGLCRRWQCLKRREQRSNCSACR